MAVTLNSAFAGETNSNATTFSSNRTAASDVSNPAKNLARMNCGATIEVIGPDGRIVSVTGTDPSARELLLDDDTLNYPLPEGYTTFILSFPRTSTLDRFMFVNENAAAEGEMTVAVSNYRLPAQSRKWNAVSGSTSFTGKRLFDLSLLGTEARFVKLSFHATKGGSIGAFGLYGEQSLQKFAARQRGVIRVTNSAATRRLEDMLNFNFANLYARARIVFISSGMEEYAGRMIDDNVVTAFEFAPADPHPTVIVELADRERLHRVSAVYKMEKGRMDVFLLHELGANPGDLSAATPIASAIDTEGGGKSAVDFHTHGARYVALRWTPADAKGPRGFEVAEVSAFGEMPLSMLSTQELPDVYAENFTGLKSPPLVVQAPVLPVVSQ
ncbi:MAG: hypothetical protein M3N48_06855 [Verrucomicrobiota bacterium]|nr:hypothetical protein [Verrucomicrobiota bacterium]